MTALPAPLLKYGYMRSSTHCDQTSFSVGGSTFEAEDAVSGDMTPDDI